MEILARTQDRRKIRLIGLIVTLAVLGAGIVTAWAVYGEDIEDNSIAVAELKTEGCAPSGRNSLNVALIQKDIETIQKSQVEIKVEQKAMRAEQRAGFEEILERLP